VPNVSTMTAVPESSRAATSSIGSAATISGSGTTASSSRIAGRSGPAAAESVMRRARFVIVSRSFHSRRAAPPAA
jgi:hypothetical protein